MSGVFDGPDVGASQSEAIELQFADAPEEGNRLPIFEAVKSDWFRRGGQAVTRFGYGAVSSGISGSWTSPADEGWRAAEVVHALSSGVPRRRGSQSGCRGPISFRGRRGKASPVVLGAPARSAAGDAGALRLRLPQGVRKGRAAVGEDAGSRTEDDAPNEARDRDR